MATKLAVDDRPPKDKGELVRFSTKTNLPLDSCTVPMNLPLTLSPSVAARKGTPLLAAISAPTRATSRSRTRILIVEDNEMNRDMLSRRIERRGYEVVIAVDGEAGIEAALAHGPDLVLMDISAVLDGWEASRRIKADPRRPPFRSSP